MSKKRIFISLALTGMAILSSPSYAETLKESVDRALAAHPSLEAAMATKKVNEEDRAEARSGFFPEISANASAGRIYADNSTSRGLTVTRGAAYSWFGEGNAAITQPIFDAFETSNRVDAAQARILSAELNVSDVKENLALQAVQAHIAVAQAKDVLAKIKNYQSIIEDYSTRIQVMVDDGVADEAELAQANNISLALQGAATDYEGQLQAAYASYREVVGQMPTGDITRPQTVTGTIDANVDAAIKRAKSEHPLILSSMKEIEAAKYDIKAEKAGYYPDIDGEVSYLQRDQREEIGGEAEDARALLKMSWAFEVGGGQNARTRRTKAEYAEAVARNAETMRAIEGEVRRAYAEYDTAQKQLAVINKREEAAQDLLEAYKVQFEGAIVRLLQIMQAENQLFNTQLEAITANYRSILAHYIVLGSIGKLNEDLHSGVKVALPQTYRSVDIVVENSEDKHNEISFSDDTTIEHPAENNKVEFVEDKQRPTVRVSKYVDTRSQKDHFGGHLEHDLEESSLSGTVSKDIESQLYNSKNQDYKPTEAKSDTTSMMETSGRVYIDSK